MRCLLRSPDDPFPYRDTEGRPSPPRVTVQKKSVTVEQRVTTWVNNLQPRDFGVWDITEGKRLWTLELRPPPALDRAWWQKVSVDLGGRAARKVSSAPTTGSDTKLTWAGKKAGAAPPEVRITLQPPATKAAAAWWSEDPGYVLYQLGWIPWDLAVLVLLLSMVRGLRRDPASSPAGEAEKQTVRNLRNFGCLTFAVTVVAYFDDPLLAHYANHDTALFWTDRHRIAVHLALTLLTGLALCVFGRPGRLAVAAVTGAAGWVTAVACRPEWFGLPGQMWLNSEEDWEVDWFRQTGGMYAFTAACACLVLVWLVGATASLLRLWRSCGAPAPGSSRGRFPLPVLGVLVLVSAAIPAVSLWAAENAWEQQSWLSRRSEELYGAWHVASLFDDFRWFPVNWLDWFFETYFWWWGPSVAIVAVLRARAASAGPSVKFPAPSEERTLKLFFVVGVAPVAGWYAGFPLPLVPLLALWLAMVALLAFGRRRSVLHRPLLPGHPLHLEIDESRRRKLLKSARRHRELHAQLRRLEQGQQDGERKQLEWELDELHRLRHPRRPNAWVRLPSSVGPVELALAWGPRATWWQNACRAAYFAALIALPADAVLLWAEQLRGSLWSDAFTARFGFADMVASVVADELMWAGAGFTLGALWRVLPGRRGPARALGVWLVYSAPVLVQWIGTRIVEQSFDTWALNVSLTLLVLTLTGVAMDIDTFRREGHYWPTRAGLLLSVYQWRTASVQVAFLLAQFVALVSIWQQLKGGDPMVLIQKDPGELAGGGGSGGP